MDPPQLWPRPARRSLEVRHVRGAQVATSRGQETLKALRCGGQQASQPVETGAPKQSAIASAARSTGRC